MIKLHSRTQSNPVGKPPKFVATFKGDIKGITATLKLEAETERDIMFKIPCVPKKELDIEIIDLNSVISDFQTDNSKFTNLGKRLKAQAEEDEAFRSERKARSEAQA